MRRELAWTLLWVQSVESSEEFLHNTTMATPLVGDVKIVQGSSMGDIGGVYKSCSGRQTRIHVQINI